MLRLSLFAALLSLLAACSSDSDGGGGAVTVAGAGGIASGGGAGLALIAGQGVGAAAGSGIAGSTPLGSAGRAGMVSAGTNGAAGRAGSAAAGSGVAGTAGGERGGSGGMAAAAGGGGSAGSAGEAATTEKFSFFVTSLTGLVELSKSDKGFGGDLRFGEATGLAGADKICTTLAEKSMPGSGAKGWRAFLSASKGGANGGAVNARDRIGQGPWYDRLGRLVAMNVSALVMDRPMDADTAIRNDLPNERGEPNHTTTMSDADDNHDTVTGSNAMGMFDSSSSNTCMDWTSTQKSGDRGPVVGHSWPSNQSGTSWIRAHNAPGCAPSVSLVQMGGGSGDGIGNGGGYGGFYCFALKP